MRSAGLPILFILLVAGMLYLSHRGSNFKSLLASPNEVCEGYVFTTVCQSFCSQGGSTWAVTPGRYTLRAGTRSGQVQPPSPGAVHAGRYWQQAGGTHPTGMHFCLQLQTVGIEPIGCFVRLRTLNFLIIQLPTSKQRENGTLAMSIFLHSFRMTVNILHAKRILMSISMLKS